MNVTSKYNQSPAADEKKKRDTSVSFIEVLCQGQIGDWTHGIQQELLPLSAFSSYINIGRIVFSRLIGNRCYDNI